MIFLGPHAWNLFPPIYKFLTSHYYFPYVKFLFLLVTFFFSFVPPFLFVDKTDDPVRRDRPPAELTGEGRYVKFPTPFLWDFSPPICEISHLLKEIFLTPFLTRVSHPKWAIFQVPNTKYIFSEYGTFDDDSCRLNFNVFSMILLLSEIILNLGFFKRMQPCAIAGCTPD